MSLVQEKALQCVAAFDKLERDVGLDGPAWLRDLRKEAIARFAERGLPTLRDEEWRFTDLAPILRLPYQPVLQHDQNGLSPLQIERVAFRGLRGPRLVFVNGRYAKDFSSAGRLEKGLVVESLAEAAGKGAGPVKKHLARYVRGDDNAFAALSTSFMQDGGFVHIPEETAVDEPIYLLFISVALQDGAVTHPRNLVIAGRNSRASIIEHYVCIGDSAFFTNAVTELVVEENAVVEHCRTQDESPEAFHVATLQAQLQARSAFTSHNLAMGARLNRNDLRMVLDGERVGCTLNGLYVASGRQHMDNHTFIDHAKPECASHELYRGILGGESRGVFKGKILVRPGAQKTDAKQTNNNLLLSDGAMIDTMPQLEIFADDVKCTHGATVGQLSDDAIFYLRSRGIDAASARDLLIRAFASDVIDRISSEPVREGLSQRIGDILQGSLKTGERP